VTSLATEHFVSLSTVSLRLIKQPEHRPDFQSKLEKELRDILDIPKTVDVTTMPDTPLWWQRAKTIAEQLETERKYAEEHPECAKSPTRKHEWRYGTCVWCGTSATETVSTPRTSDATNEREKPMVEERQVRIKRLLEKLDKAIKDEEDAIRMYDDIIADMPIVFAPDTIVFQDIRSIGEDEKKHYSYLQPIRSIVRRMLTET